MAARGRIVANGGGAAVAGVWFGRAAHDPRERPLSSPDVVVSENASAKLSKSLLARHLVMISIGGIIGGGVFVGSSGAIATIGPAVLLSYISAGIVVFGVITILARMAMDQPGLGSFT